MDLKDERDCDGERLKMKMMAFQPDGLTTQVPGMHETLSNRKYLGTSTPKSYLYLPPTLYSEHKSLEMTEA